MSEESGLRSADRPPAGTRSGGEHPPEDALIGLALGEENPGVRAHVDSCEQCRSFVEDMRGVKETMASLGDQDPPEEIHELVMRTIRRPRVADTVESMLQSPLSRTFLLGLAVVLYVIFMFSIVALLDMGG
jgi:hypothetical protein